MSVAVLPLFSKWDRQFSGSRFHMSAGFLPSGLSKLGIAFLLRFREKDAAKER